MRTAISRTSRGVGNREAGFTLIELLAVLGILAIAITAFTYAGTGSLETARFRAFLVKTSAMLVEGRAEAMSGMRDKLFIIDLKNRKLGFAGEDKRLDLPAGVELSVTASEEESGKDGALGIRFYPAGNSSGGTLQFTLRNQIYEMRVNWLTGNIVTRRV